MTIVFDLDHTLFDTALFKQDLFKVFEESGVSRKMVEDTYEQHLKEVSGNYNFETHAGILEKRLSTFKREEARKNFLVFMRSDFKKYVSQGTLRTLKELQSQGMKLVLLSKGSKEIQMQKIQQSGLSSFFDQIIICQGSKAAALAELKLGSEDCFINDHWGETKSLKKDFPEPRYFLLKRGDLEKYHALSEIDVPILLSLGELLEKI